MKAKFRNYDGTPGYTPDFFAVSEFLLNINTSRPINYDFEWSRWEWAISHPMLDESNLAAIGLWEDAGRVVGLATYEHQLGTAYLIVDPAYDQLWEELVVYAKESLCDSGGELKILINDQNQQLQQIAASHEFTPTQDREGNSALDIRADSANYSLPPGYSLRDATGDFDIKQFNACLWKGFNHAGDPPESAQDLAERKKMITQPHIKLALNSVVVSPNGEYCSYCGIWYDERTDYAMIEPVATVPEHRMLGLGRAAVLESVRKCGEMGASRAYVGSSQQFYYQIGFYPLPSSTMWKVDARS